MKASLAYIDETIDAELKERHAAAPSKITDAERKSAKRQSIKVVAGFEIADEKAEKAALDALIADRRAMIDLFLQERTKLTKKLGAKGITPLAVVPTVAWHNVCDAAGLFRLSPNPQGQVLVRAANLYDFLEKGAQDGINQWGRKFNFSTFRASATGQRMLEELARKNWPAYLRTLFGGQVSSSVALSQGQSAATLVLPTPPADVQEILLKAHGTFDLKVAAVAEAIRFKETPTEILDRVAKGLEEESRRYEAWKEDPIIYVEDGMATAIIAQFGDFPIEKEIVDAAVKTKDLLPEKPTPVQTMQVISQDGISNLYQQQMLICGPQGQPIMHNVYYGSAMHGGGGGGIGGWTTIST